jgi:hypothetical protein
VRGILTNLGTFIVNCPDCIHYNTSRGSLLSRKQYNVNNYSGISPDFVKELIAVINKFDVILTVHHSIDLFQNQLNAQFLYSVTIYMLHYNPRHVSSINTPICRRTNCTITASGIVTFCKRLYSMPDENAHPAYCTIMPI